MSAAAAFRRRDVNASDAIAEVLHPNMGYREKLRRRGVEPKNFERANRLKLKQQQAEQRERKQAEAAARPEAFKLTKFKAVQPRVFQEKTRVDEEEPPKRHDFLRRGASTSALSKKKTLDTPDTDRPKTAIDSARATDGSIGPKSWMERPKTRSQVKPPLPSKQELEALSEQLAKLHHKAKPDFVNTNAWEVIKAAPARPLEDESGNRVKHDSFGRIPEYLMQRKEEWAREEEERRRNMPDPDCPPGMMRLDEDERVHTLSVLKQSLEQAQHQISRLPLRIETLRQIRKKDELLARVQEIEDAIQVFSKSKVYVAKPAEAASPSKTALQDPATAHRRFRRPSQSNATAA